MQLAQDNLTEACEFAALCAEHARACEALHPHITRVIPPVVFDPATGTIGTHVEDYVAANAAMTAASLKLATLSLTMSLRGHIVDDAPQRMARKRPASTACGAGRAPAPAPAAATAAAPAKNTTTKKKTAATSAPENRERKGQGGACIYCAKIRRRCAGGNRNSTDPVERTCVRCAADNRECVYPIIKPKRPSKPRATAAAAAAAAAQL